MAQSTPVSQHDGKYFGIKKKGETKNDYSMQDFRRKSSSGYGCWKYRVSIQLSWPMSVLKLRLFCAFNRYYSI